MLNIAKIISFDMDQNCYLIYGDSKKGALIDPGKAYQKILNKIDELGVEVEYIILTHCHYDHTESVNRLRGHKKLVCSSECDRNIRSSKYNLSAFAGDAFEIDGADIILDDGDSITIDGIELKAIATPGHTDGGMCYLVENNLFSGDTLFKRSIGRWDFPTGDGELLQRSIKEKLYTLPDDVTVYPGHGESTTIEYEKKFNMYVTE